MPSATRIRVMCSGSGGKSRMEGVFKLLWIIVLVAVCVATVIRARRSRERINQSFARMRFDTPNGTVTGADLVIISKRQRFIGAMYEQRAVPGAPGMPSDAFWFCFGPGPSYFLAIPMFERRWEGDSIEWIQR